MIAEQPAPSARLAEFLRREPRVLIGGEWLPVETRLPVTDPATGREIAWIADAGAAEVGRAVEAARTAFERGAWPQTTPAGREALLLRLAELIEHNADQLAELESLDNGKPRAMAAMIDVPASRDYVRYMAGWATKIEGATFETSLPRTPGGRFHTYTAREAVGVVAQIVPWNFPLLMAVWKLAPALAAGCTCILKPAEH